MPDVIRYYTDILEVFIETTNGVQKGWFPVAPLPDLQFNDRVSSVSLTYVDFATDGEQRGSGVEEYSLERLKKANLTTYAYTVYKNGVEISRCSFMCVPKLHNKILDLFRYHFECMYGSIGVELKSCCQIKVYNHIINCFNL